MADEPGGPGDGVTSSAPPNADDAAAGPAGAEVPKAGIAGALPAPGIAEQPKSGGLGGIIGAILRGLAPTVRRATRTTSRVRRRSPGRSGRAGSTGSAGSAGSRGTLLQLRYHAGGAASWETARVAFGRRGNRIAVIASSDAAWWRHIRGGSPVQVHVRNRWVDGRARLVSRDEDTYARAVGIFIEDRSRAAAERLGVPMDEQGRLVHGERRPGDAVVVWIEVEGD